MIISGVSYSGGWELGGMQPATSTTTDSMFFVYGFFVLFCLGLSFVFFFKGEHETSLGRKSWGRGRIR